MMDAIQRAKKVYMEKYKLRTYVSEAELFQIPYDYMDEIANSRKKVLESGHEHHSLHMEPVPSIRYKVLVIR
jgi:hypothetical protein